MPVRSEKANLTPSELATLLRGDAETTAQWSAQWNARRFGLHLAVIVFGAGIYGAAMGWWRAPEQALFVAIKFPLIILLTTLGNALINAMLAPLLGLDIPFRQSVSAVVMSFTVTSAILGAFSPLIAFLVWCEPSMTSSHESLRPYNFMLLAHVAVIALAGTTGNARLFQLLVRLGNRAAAYRVLCAWLAGNLFLGSQLSWILRPFIGSPELKVEFIRSAALHGNFYEAVWTSIQRIFH